MINFSEDPHRRFNPLTGEWILVSPHRTKRPWQGKVEESARDTRPTYDPACYLCPGNKRAEGAHNPAYESTFVFENDFAALLPQTPAGDDIDGDLFIAHAERGLCKVICFSPRHDLTLALMDKAQVRSVVDIWVEQYKEVGAIDYVNYVQIFENRGDIMGCSNPHPHGQIWATQTIPHLVSLEDNCQKHYKAKKQCCLLCDYVHAEIAKKERIVFENDTFVALVPFWAVWPYETMILPKVHLSDIAALSPQQSDDLADAMRRMAIRFDNLFKTSFPYSMGIHQKPTTTEDNSHWHFHVHFLPPLLRSATVRKFMVGYELLAQPQRDITPEASALKLRDCSEVHYLRT